MKLLIHQIEVLERTKDLNHVAYYLDMGLGKTFVGAEKLNRLNKKVNLVICQKSKINDWCEHLYKHYGKRYLIFDLTNKEQYADFFNGYEYDRIGIINYELAWRRKDLLKLEDFTLMLDESSLIQNHVAKQSKFIMKLEPTNVILLSGTPCAGKYENLWTQARLLNWNISKSTYDGQYINFEKVDYGTGFKVKVLNKKEPYKNVERLKRKFTEHGAVFMKTEDVLDLPQQNFIPVMVDKPKEYDRFIKDDYVNFKGLEFIASTSLTKRLFARQLASAYNEHKLEAVKDLIASTSDRLVIFYNFNDELHLLKSICNAQNRPVSEVNGHCKDLYAYEHQSDSVTLVQYQAGAMGINLQLASRIIYFSLPERSELFEQSKKRIHRIGQEKTCFYYLLLAKKSVDELIYQTLQQRKDFTDELFREVMNYSR